MIFKQPSLAFGIKASLVSIPFWVQTLRSITSILIVVKRLWSKHGYKELVYMGGIEWLP